MSEDAVAGDIALNDKAQLAERWRFSWPIMEVLIGGKSSLDLAELKLDTWASATEFLRGYGYDPDDDADLRVMHGVIVEALSFIDSVLLEDGDRAAGIKPPDEVLLCTDPRHLIMLASTRSPEERLKRAWACAVLRVMHTIAHIEGVYRLAHLSIARDQIMERLQKHIYRDEERRLWLGEDAHRVELERVEWKEAKSRQSIVVKLLHKKDNVAESIYDYLGVRFVTKKTCDTMLVVKNLHKYNMITYANCYPARSRNTLVDFERFRSQIETLREMLISGAIGPEEFESMVTRIEQLPTATPGGHITPAPPNNPHTLEGYRSIQMTCRQRIRLGPQQFEWLSKLHKGIDRSRLPADLATILTDLIQLIQDWYSVEDQREAAVFFPFEVQILDREAYERATQGDASHDAYKLAQVATARKRVLGKVIELAKGAPPPPPPPPVIPE